MIKVKKNTYVQADMISSMSRANQVSYPKRDMEYTLTLTIGNEKKTLWYKTREARDQVYHNILQRYNNK